MYVICRTTKPEIVVETGVANGVSSYCILQALEKNGRGRLYSIDLPVDNLLPPNKETGWLVPSYLQRRWMLKIGPTSQLLPPLLDELGQVNLFLHDSEHTYMNMMFEFDAVWPHVWEGGLILSDNVYDNSAFRDFCKKHQRKWIQIANLGGMRK